MTLTGFSYMKGNGEEKRDTSREREKEHREMEGSEGAARDHRDNLLAG